MKEKTKQENFDEKDRIGKAVVLKNFLQFTNDKALLKTVLNESGKESFTEKEIFELLKKEITREVR